MVLSIACALEKNVYSAVDWRVLYVFVRANQFRVQFKLSVSPWSSSIVLSVIENGVLKSPTDFGGLYFSPQFFQCCVFWSCVKCVFVHSFFNLLSGVVSLLTVYHILCFLKVTFLKFKISFISQCYSHPGSPLVTLFWPRFVAGWPQFPNQRLSQCSLQWSCGVLTSGLPGSPLLQLLSAWKCFLMLSFLTSLCFCIKSEVCHRECIDGSMFLKFFAQNFKKICCLLIATFWQENLMDSYFK